MHGAVCCERACLTGLWWCVVAVVKNGSNTSGVYRFKLQEGRFVFLQTKSKLFYNHATQAPEYILSTHSIIRSVHIFSRSIVRSVHPVDRLHHQVSTSCRHTPSSGQYTLSTHSIIRSVHLIFSRSIVRSAHLVFTLHRRVSTSHLHMPWVCWYCTSCLHTPSSGQYIGV